MGLLPSKGVVNETVAVAFPGMQKHLLEY